MNKIGDLSDEELVEVVRDEDQELYAEIVGRYEEKLMRYANYLLKDEAAAQDIVQNGFIKAFVNLRGFDTRRKFSSWIYRIVHNEAVNEIKKGSKLINWSAEKWKRQEGDSEDMVDKMSEQEVVALLEKNLGKMELKYKEVLVLYYLEEKSYEEISEILRVPMGTVGVRISRAKIQLKKIYEENE